MNNIKTAARRWTTLALAAGVCAGLVCALPIGAQAQDPTTTGGVTKKISLTFQNASIVTVLKTLFSSVGINNSIDQSVTGTVTIDVRDVSFTTALNALLRAANPPLSYDQNDGIYHIFVKNTAPDTTTQTTQPGPVTQTATLPEGFHAYRIPIDHYDAAYIASLLAKKGTGVTVVTPNFVYASSGGGGAGGGGGRGGGGGFGGGGGGGFGGSSGGFGGSTGGSLGGSSGGFGGSTGGGIGGF